MDEGMGQVSVHFFLCAVPNFPCEGIIHDSRIFCSFQTISCAAHGCDILVDDATVM